MEIGDRIKYLRKSHLKMTQTEFAAELGTSRSVICNIEDSRLRQPQQKDPIYKLICEKYGISYKWLTTGDGEMLEPMNRSEEIAKFVAGVMRQTDENFKKRFVAMLAALDESDWELLEKIAEKLKEPV